MKRYKKKQMTDTEAIKQPLAQAVVEEAKATVLTINKEAGCKS